MNVPQRFFRSIKKDILADVYISEFPEKVFKGFVARYAKALDPIARTLLTEVHIQILNMNFSWVYMQRLNFYLNLIIFIF